MGNVVRARREVWNRASVDYGVYHGKSKLSGRATTNIIRGATRYNSVIIARAIDDGRNYSPVICVRGYSHRDPCTKRGIAANLSRFSLN